MTQKTRPNNPQDPQKTQDANQTPDTQDPQDNQSTTTDNQIEQIQAEFDQIKAQSQRALADYANLKKRFDRERLEIGSFVTESVVTQLLPSIDNLDRAVQFATDDEKKSALFQGLDMTMQHIHQVFTDLGVSKIQAEVDTDFDPHIHEAIDTAAGPQGKIVRQLQPGFSLNDKVIRPAQVTVGNGQTSH